MPRLQYLWTNLSEFQFKANSNDGVTSLPDSEILLRYVKPFWHSTSMLQTNGQTDKENCYNNTKL